MIRLLGILLGSAIAVAMLILLVGVPQLVDRKAAEPVTVQLPLEAQPVETADTLPPDSLPAADPPSPPPPPPVATTLPEPEQLPGPEPQPEPAPLPEPEPLQELSTPATEQRWFAFWSPFRSQIAANGFVTQLQRVTGLDYRVVSVKPGVYEVAFAYSDDDEIQANLSQISAATGLEVPGS